MAAFAAEDDAAEDDAAEYHDDGKLERDMLHHRTLTVLLLGMLASVAQAVDSWPSFRGPDGDGVVRGEVELPTQWSDTRNVSWRTELPGSGWSSPVVGNGRVYLTAAIPVEGQPMQLSLLIVDASNGDLLKTVKVMEQLRDRPVKNHSKNSHASPTPILDGDRIFVHFGYQGTACLTLDGDPIWLNRDFYFNPTHGNGGSPILVGDRLIFTCDGDEDPKVVALDASAGELVWQARRTVSATKTFSFCTPSAIVVDGQTQVIAPGSDCVMSLDPTNGNIIWEVHYTGYSVVPKPVYHRGLVLVATSFDRSKMLAIRPTGTGLVTDSHVQWRVDKNMPKTPSLIADRGLIYTISDDGIATCVEADSGEVVYRERIGGNFSASPILAGENLYFTSEQGVTTVVRAGREFEKISENEMGERTLASLAVIDRSLLIRTAGALYRIQ